MSDLYNVYVVDCETEERLESLGTCLGDNNIPELYADELNKWEDRNCCVEIGWSPVA